MLTETQLHVPAHRGWCVATKPVIVDQQDHYGECQMQRSVILRQNVEHPKRITKAVLLVFFSFWRIETVLNSIDELVMVFFFLLKWNI